MKSYEYKLYRNKRTSHIEHMCKEACFVWNHALALQKRYYSLYGKYINSVNLKKHFAKRIKRTYLHSQSAQEVLQRLDAAYKRFFQHKAKRPPKFKKHRDFRSFVFKQGGYSLSGNVLHINSVTTDYKFSYSRPYEGNVKQIRLKCSPKGDWFLYVITDAQPTPIVKSHNGASIGIDFGLKTYITFSDGNSIQNPQFLKKGLKKLKSLSKTHSKKKKGSKSREYARYNLANYHEHLSNSRRDWQRKLAHELCRRYDYIFIEDLCLTGMTRLWGRKMNDLAHGQFVSILEETAQRYGCVVYKIDRYYPSSKLCDCGHKNDKLTLSDREWVCPECGCIHDRDVHAAENILRRGIYELTSGSKTNEATVKGHSAKTCKGRG